MVEPRSGSPERSGQSGPPAATDVTDSPSQSNPSHPNRETNGSGKRTIGGSYVAAKRRAEQRNSDPSLPTVSSLERTEARITNPLSHPTPQLLDTMDQPPEPIPQTVSAFEYNSPSYNSQTPLPPADTTEPASSQLPEASLSRHHMPLPAPDTEQTIFPFVNITAPDTTIHRQLQIPPQLFQSHTPLPQSATPDVVFPPLPTTPSKWPTLSAPTSIPEEFSSSLAPFSLSTSMLIDPTAVTHLGLNKITQVLPAITKEKETPLVETHQSIATNQYISAESLVDPALFPPSTPNLQLNSPDVADLPTIQMTISPITTPKVSRPIYPIGPIKHPADYTFPKAEPHSSSSPPQKPKREGRIFNALIDAIAWTTGPLINPLEEWNLRRRISRLEPPDRAIVEAFTHPQPPKPSPDTPSPYQTVSMEYPPYPLPVDSQTTERTRALTAALPLFASTAVFRRSNNTAGFTGYGEDQNTSVEVEITDTMDIIGSIHFENGSGVEVFIANPLDATYPHETRLVFGMKPENRDEAFFSLNTSQSEKKMLHQVALHIARIAANTLQQRKVSYDIRQQLNFVFLSALANAWEEEIPRSEPTKTSLNGSGWGYIKTLQQTLSSDTVSTFAAYFDLYSAAQHRKETEASDEDLLTSAEGDLRIDSFLTPSSAQTAEENLFYILPKQGPPRIVGTNSFAENEPALIAAIRKRSLIFLSALASREEPNRQRRKGEERTPLDRMDEITTRLQQFVLQYTPEGLPNEAIMQLKQ